jgi:hypothetical protein
MKTKQQAAYVPSTLFFQDPDARCPGLHGTFEKEPLRKFARWAHHGFGRPLFARVLVQSPQVSCLINTHA